MFFSFSVTKKSIDHLKDGGFILFVEFLNILQPLQRFAIHFNGGFTLNSPKIQPVVVSVKATTAIQRIWNTQSTKLVIYVPVSNETPNIDRPGF